MKPEQALHKWAISSLANIDSSTIKRASSGLLNKTYIIRPQADGSKIDELYILQLVHPAVSMDGAMNNYFHVTQFLLVQGLTSQSMLKTPEGNLWIEDDEQEGWRWRLLLGVEGNFFDIATDSTMAEEAGKLLGQFHSVLSQYPKELEIGRLSFRYDKEIEKLNHFQEQLMADPDESVRSATKILLEELPKLALPTDLPQHIIHADPKISNFLFDDNGKGVCLIDLDTVQRLSPLYDLGDAMRSWCGQAEDDPNNSFNLDVYNAFLSGYFSTSKNLLSEQEKSLIPQAGKLIMLGLAVRFLNDYVEDTYFGWDETKYESRKAHNKARVLGQLSLYQSAIKSI